MPRRRRRSGARSAAGPGANDAPFAVEIGFEPRIVGTQEFFDFPDGDDLAVAEHRDPVADGEQAVEIVRDHEHREAERFLQRGDEIVEIAGRNRIEARGRLVEEDDLRIERERARERHALGHAAREFGGVLVGGVLRQSDQLQFLRGQPVHHVLRQAAGARASASRCSAAP